MEAVPFLLNFRTGDRNSHLTNSQQLHSDSTSRLNLHTPFKMALFVQHLVYMLQYYPPILLAGQTHGLMPGDEECANSGLLQFVS